jgi:hypothetical protein
MVSRWSIHDDRDRPRLIDHHIEATTCSPSTASPAAYGSVFYRERTSRRMGWQKGTARPPTV